MSAVIPFFRTLFGVCPTFRSRITAIYTFLSFLCGFLFAGVRKTQEDTLKVFIYQKYLGMQNNKHGGDRMWNTDSHKIHEFEWRLNTDSTN